MTRLRTSVVMIVTMVADGLFVSAARDAGHRECGGSDGRRGRHSGGDDADDRSQRHRLPARAEREPGRRFFLQSRFSR